jgi:hypothetical protein
MFKYDTSEAGTADPSGAHRFTPGLSELLCCTIFSFLSSVLSIICCCFFVRCFFLVVVVLFWSLVILTLQL